MANTSITDAANMVAAEEQRVTLALKTIVDKFTSDLDLLNESNELPATFTSEGRNLLNNVKGSLGFQLQMIDNAASKYMPVPVITPVPAAQ